MTVGDLARAAHVSPDYARALEDGDWRTFVAKVYARGTLLRILGVIRPEEQRLIWEAFNREWPPEQQAYAHRRETRRQGEARFLLTPGRLGALAAAGLALAILGFWSARLFVFAARPSLAVESPADRSRIAKPLARVKGSTEKESRLTVNGRELRIDERGNFDEEIELPLGANSLRFISESRFGKVSEEVRYILME